MDGSDDYFIDEDIVLDEATLAVLDSAEQRYLTQAAPPPAKRQKTDNGWKPAPVQGRSTALDDNEDLPEISVHGDGSYAFRGATKAAAQNSTAFPHASKSAHIAQAVALPHQRVANVPTALRATTHMREEPASRPRDSVPQSTTRTRLHPDPQRVVALDSSQVLAEELRKQIEELRSENQKYQRDLKDATDAKLAKQGEVTILRKGIEKVAQDHATQVAKLKLAKEESEAKQIALQKDMKAEMERLKTQFIFKQHELESSSRKPPLSVRSKKITRDFPSTPLAVPSQIRGWNQNANHTGFPEQSPVRSRLVKGSPQGVHTRRTPEKSKKPVKLLGFQNSFTDDTPVRTAQSRAKEAEMFTRPTLLPKMSPPASPIPFPQQLNDVKMTEPKDFADELTGGGSAYTERSTDENALDEIEPFNWKAELTRMILTHTFPPNTSPTLKILVGLALPLESADRHSEAVTRILELVASTSQHKDYETSLLGVCRCLTLMLKILNGTELTSALAALLNLLTCLSCSLPLFAPSLLAAEKGDDSDIIEVVCTIIRDNLQPAKHTHSGSALGAETVGLLEGLCWNVKDDLMDRLAVICNSKDVLMILLDMSQPSWLLGRSTRLLVLLATHPKLSRELLSSSETVPPSDGVKLKDSQRYPHIERLCSYLIDASRRDNEAVETKSQILTFFGILSVAHADVHAVLMGCQVLVPSLVAFLTQMATFLWEGDEFVTTSEAIGRIIRTLNQTLFLLHHLVFGLEPTFNLRQRLHYAPSRTFNGITHMFIVTFGRLSCADPPDWIDAAQKVELEAMSEMAQDLLDLVVDGPEGDSIWAAYQADDPGNSDTDEEDMEAKLLGTY